MNSVDPSAGQVGQRGQVVIRRQPLGLQTPHLADRYGPPVETLANHDGPHDGSLLGQIDIYCSKGSTFK